MSINQLMTERPELLPALALAYIGDGVYELQVRKYLLNKGIYKVDDLHKRAIGLVCANTQANVARHIAGELTPFEMGVLHRGRNAKGQHSPKGANNITTYRIATGLEALVGYWYLSGEEARLGWFFQTLWQYAEDNDVKLNQDFTLDDEEDRAMQVDIEEEFRAELEDIVKSQLEAVQKAD